MSDAYVPEPDAAEQHQERGGESEEELPEPAPAGSPEAPEADALEQSEEVESDEDEWRS